MVKRKIVEIDEEKCDGCGVCIPDCPEGALQIIDNKARLISDLFCDGLGACLNSCPQDAIKVAEREAEPYDEKKVMENIVKQGSNVIKAHLEHLRDHGETAYLKEAVDYLKERNLENPFENTAKRESKFCGCPGSKVMNFRNKTEHIKKEDQNTARQTSELRQWPIQLMLLPPYASHFNDADLLIAADCVPFSYANFHNDFLKNKTLIIGCPKLDDVEHYKEKLTEIIKTNKIKSITIVHMEVPCCYGLQSVVEEAVKDSGKEINVMQKIISIQGDVKNSKK